MDPHDSGELVARAQAADRGALEQLLIRHLPGVEGYLRLRMGPRMRARESCSDVVQSVAREVLEDLSGFDYRGEPAFRRWLYTRAHHKLMEHHRWHTADKRDAGREEPGVDALLASYRSLATPSADLAAREAVARIEQAFDELPDDWREAITLHRIVGLSHAEIAAELGRSEGAVRNLVYRGLSRMALRLAGEDDPR